MLNHQLEEFRKNSYEIITMDNTTKLNMQFLYI